MQNSKHEKLQAAQGLHENRTLNLNPAMNMVQSDKAVRRRNNRSKQARE